MLSVALLNCGNNESDTDFGLEAHSIVSKTMEGVLNYLPQASIATGLEAAKLSYDRAHRPWFASIHHGAAVITESGNVYIGTEVQNAGYPASFSSALAVAVRNAVIGGERNFQGAFFYGETIDSLLNPFWDPIGKSVLNEFGSILPIFYSDRDGETLVRVFQSSPSQNGHDPKTYRAPNYNITHSDPETADKYLRNPLLASEMTLEEARSIVSRCSVINPEALFNFLQEKYQPFSEISELTVTRSLAMSFLASGNAYCPVSNYAVGAAMVNTKGEIAPGVNIENYLCAEAGTCGERAALGHGAALGIAGLDKGDKAEPSLIVTTVPASVPASPCGECRQSLVEVTTNAPVLYICSTGIFGIAPSLAADGVVEKYDFTDPSNPKSIEINFGLLPDHFGGKMLRDEV